MLYANGVSREFERLKWEAELREKLMDKYIEALLKIRKVVHTGSEIDKILLTVEI